MKCLFPNITTKVPCCFRSYADSLNNLIFEFDRSSSSSYICSMLFMQQHPINYLIRYWLNIINFKALIIANCKILLFDSFKMMLKIKNFKLICQSTSLPNLYFNVLFPAKLLKVILHNVIQLKVKTFFQY